MPAALAAHPSAAPADTGPALRRPVSQETANHLSEGMPGYSPQAALAQDQARARAQAQVLADASATNDDGSDKPKNEIIRLPDYIVSQRPPPVFRPKEIMTKKALVAQMFKEHPGLNLWGLMPFASLNAPIAEEMFDEDQRLKDISDMRDTAISTGLGGDKAESDDIKKETQQTFMHDVWGSNDENDGK